MRLNRVGSSVVSAMTQTPASGPCGPETTPPTSLSPIAIAAASFCACARAGTDTAANNAAARSTGSLFLILMSSSLRRRPVRPCSSRDLLDLPKVGRSDRADSHPGRSSLQTHSPHTANRSLSALSDHMLATAARFRRRTGMKPETVGMSSARLARLDEVMKRRYVDGGYLPGMLTHVYRKGHLVHTGICGRMDIERDKPMREDAIFRIYSMSKPITAVALMMLVEEGLVGLDDDVHSHIPAWKNLGVYASGLASLLADAPPSFMTTPTLRPMKVIDLATHT